MQVRTFSLPPADRGEVLRYAGCRRPGQAERQLLDSCLEELGDRLTGRVCWETFPVSAVEGGLDLGFAVTGSRGLGRRLYGALMELLRMQGILTAHALVTSPNPDSQALHEAMGFHLAATHRLAGFKAGDWHDVLWYERELAPRKMNPAPPVPLRALRQTQVAAVLEAFSAAHGAPEKS